MEKIRPAAVAGMFYPAGRYDLESEVRLLLSATDTGETTEDVTALIVPHAGYVYSGKTAASAYNKIQNKNYKTIIIISPSHREYFQGISVYDGDAYSTPLGNISVNKEKRRMLTSSQETIFVGHKGHGREHALEVQLPFLQVLLQDFTIVPVVIGDQHKTYNYELGRRLADICDDSTLVIASSDLSHFHPKDEADMLDTIVENHIRKFDYEGLQRDLETGHCEACGGGPIIAAMRAAELLNKTRVEILSRSDSGDVTGDSAEVVGYLSAMIYG